METGKRIRIARKNAGMKQAELARRMNMARTTVVAIERGTRQVNIQELQQIAGHLEVEYKALLPEGEEELSVIRQERSWMAVTEDEREVVKAWRDRKWTMLFKLIAEEMKQNE